jgi:hypothetical protein
MTVEKNATMTPVELILCFWGSFWNSVVVKSSSNLVYTNTIKEILGDHENGKGIALGHGFKRGSLVYIEINDHTVPNEGTSHLEVETMLTDRMKSSEMPAPIEGRERLYAVVFPPGNYQELVGQRQAPKHFVYNGIATSYICLDHSGSLMIGVTAP